jgi:hypothetical protein
MGYSCSFARAGLGEGSNTAESTRLKRKAEGRRRFILTRIAAAKKSGHDSASWWPLLEHLVDSFPHRLLIRFAVVA